MGRGQVVPVMASAPPPPITHWSLPPHQPLMSLYRHPVVALWCCGENESWTQREEEKESVGPSQQHSRSLTDIDPRSDPSQFPSYVVTSNYVVLHLESGVFKQRHVKTAAVWSAHIYAAHGEHAWGDSRLHTAEMGVRFFLFFFCTIHFSLSKCLKSLGWVCCSLCYNISIWGEDECVPFFISPPPPLFVPPPAESCCLGGKSCL